jgi:hypothetical protein
MILGLTRRTLFAAVILLSALALTGRASAVVTLQTQRLSLENVNDASGGWQHEGGRLLLAGRHIANYIVVRRVTLSGTAPQNTAAVTMTIFLLGTTPPHNLTLQGSHDYHSGRYIGSVSAASQPFMGVQQGTRFQGDAAANTLTFEIDGGSPRASRLAVTPGAQEGLILSITLQEIAFGRCKEGSVTLVNQGATPLRVRVGSLEAPFAVVAGGGEFLLDPGAKRTVTVRFCAPAGVQSTTFDATLRIISDDPEAAIVELPVRVRTS